MPDTETIILPDLDAWDEWADMNRDYLLDRYGDLDAALHAACSAGIEVGGGAAPHFHVRLDD